LVKNRYFHTQPAFDAPVTAVPYVMFRTEKLEWRVHQTV